VWDCAGENFIFWGFSVVPFHFNLGRKKFKFLAFSAVPFHSWEERRYLWVEKEKRNIF
jgi:hypothetical protein